MPLAILALRLRARAVALRLRARTPVRPLVALLAVVVPLLGPAVPAVVRVLLASRSRVTIVGTIGACGVPAALALVGLPPGLPLILACTGMLLRTAQSRPRRGVRIRSAGRWRTASPVSPTPIHFGLALPVPRPGLVLPLGPAPLRSSSIAIGRGEHVRPDRPELPQPVLGARLVAICVGPPVVGGLTAEFHLCRHSPTGNHHQPRSSAQPQATTQRVAVKITSGPAVPGRTVVAREPTGQPSHAQLPAATRLASAKLAGQRATFRRSPHYPATAAPVVKASPLAPASARIDVPDRARERAEHRCNAAVA